MPDPTETTFAAFDRALAFPISCAYRAAVGASDELRADRHAARGTRMNALLPGHIGSPYRTPETAGTIPMRRVAMVGETARTAAFLPADDAGYIIGQSLRVEGGINRRV